MPASVLNRAAWQTELERMPAELRDVYFTPDYHAMHETNGDGEPLCIAAAHERGSLLMPGLRISIDGAAVSDLQTCNGYGGPIATGAGLSDLWQQCRDVARREGIVAAFFRLHPLLDQRPFLPADALVIDDRQTVYVDLAAGLEAAWERADGRHRNMVMKGRRAGVEVTWNGDDWDGFAALYEEAMERLGAPDGLRFGRAYFHALRELPAAEIASVRIDGVLSASAIFLFGPRWAHYHLAARRADAPNHLTNSILQAAMERAAGLKLDGMHLGGGRTTAADDALLRFKCSTGGELKPFRVARWIIDEEAFSNLIDKWQRASGGAPPQWLLGYRQPIRLTAEVARG